MVVRIVRYSLWVKQRHTIDTMNHIISQNKVRESIRNDVISILICFLPQNIQNGSTDRSKKNSKGSSVNFEWLLSESDYFKRLF